MLQPQSLEAPTAMATTVLEHCEVTPPPDAAIEFSLPLVFFDLIWWDFPPNQSVLFFDFPISKSRFLDTIVPNLKQSLSLALKHFLPLAGKIIHPLISGMPISLYTIGDSVSLTISESGADFNNLTGNHQRDSREFYSYVPQLPPATSSSDSIRVPALALQVTVFPEHGVCFGFTNHHVIGDASTVVSFIQSWASINRFNGDSKYCSLPSFDRTNVQDLNGLDSTYWDLILKDCDSLEPPLINPPTNKFRATFVLREEDVQKLKKLVLSERKSATHVSSFTVACALVWICLAKSATESGEMVPDDEVEHFNFVADCRSRLNPPLPATYFGNCVVPVLQAKSSHGKLKGNDGFFIAAESIGLAIAQTVFNEKGILHDVQNLTAQFQELIGKRQFSVAGSPRFDFYGVDYGWGRPKKFEALFIDGDGAISFCKSREPEGGLEIGLSRPKISIDSFATTFTEVLGNLIP
ncbi:malonyl-coenzyme:anthocyanin 5-O-glucoside-6'''-O-malonyltransferase-like [Olea europaea var. sylvestris]|uniref:malonyl-coenzyme:anthocyanin 5-O-glucoside-6'''-O-malonyltransferase-like n=1 Tax=Olea europaea var. sylvestris TaxID=158386 RepID=UPI000C1D46BB|nr:malonyl-coenzyme:anthocyanin 5-O-glucoside-6'''-O-malonyltransferase-like [Olea europaea var. sylvestris]